MFFFRKKKDDDDESYSSGSSEYTSGDEEESYEDDEEYETEDDEEYETDDDSHSNDDNEDEADDYGDDVNDDGEQQQQDVKENGGNEQHVAIENDNNANEIKVDHNKEVIVAKNNNNNNNETKTTTTTTTNNEPTTPSSPPNDKTDETISENDLPHLLSLACEHDRVDILTSLLTPLAPYHLSSLLDPNPPTIPPLHLSVASSSLNAVNYLLRLGANPSLRPSFCDEKKYIGHSAVELLKKLNLTESNVERMTQAFVMEGWRALSEGESERVEELLEAGVDVGGLVGWARDGSVSEGCWEVLRRFGGVECPEEKKEEIEETTTTTTTKEAVVVAPATSKVTTTTGLKLKYEETEALYQSLRNSLDELKGDVSICQSLLLGGSTALVSYVKNMKAQKAQKEVEYDQYGSLWQEHQRDLIDLQMSAEVDAAAVPQSRPDEQQQPPPHLSDDILQDKITLTNAKIRTLRASLVDLTEENARNANAIEQRGLSGAVRLAKKLREELVELEHDVATVKRGEEASRWELERLKKMLRWGGDGGQEEVVEKERLVKEVERGLNSVKSVVVEESEEEEEEESDDDEDNEEESMTLPSTAIATGQSSSLTKRQALPLDFWQLLRRILGRFYHNDGNTVRAAASVIIV